MALVTSLDVRSDLKQASISRDARIIEVMQRIGSRPALIRLANAGDQFGDNAPYRIEEGVAMIDVVGVLSNAAWSWRGVTYGEIQEQLKIAAADPSVRAVLLNVNSPGGETDNAFETAQLVADLPKPCFAVCNTMAYSAAYLIASQANRIYCVPTSGGAGSIGVYCAHFDYSGMLEQSGVKVTLISAGKGKTDGNPYEPLSASALETIQAEIDRLYGEFVGFVARGRGISPTDIVKMGAKCFDGATAAMAANLVDAPGDLSTAWVDLCTQVQRGSSSPMISRKSSAASAAENRQQHKEAGMQAETKPAAAEAKVPTAEEIKALVEKAKQEGFAAAAEIAELGQLFDKPALATQFINEKKSAQEFRTKLMELKVAAEKGTELDASVMPGQDAKGAEKKPAQGKAQPWADVLKRLGIKTKEGR